MNNIAIVMITIETEKRRNYCDQSLTNLKRSGAPDDCVYVVNHKPGERTATGNVAEALRQGVDQGLKWVLFLEDDIDVCQDFLNSVGDWLGDHERDDRRIYSFSVPHQAMNACRGTAWDYPIEQFCCTQAFAIRSEDALSLSEWLTTYPDFTGPDRKTSTGAYDLSMRAWAQHYWPEIKYFLASNPSFVQHVGEASELTPGRATITMPTWPGRDWSYTAIKDIQPNYFLGGVVPTNNLFFNNHVYTSSVRKPRLLWVGDAACPSGFARSTHGILDTLQYDYDVTVLGINYNGDPLRNPDGSHKYSYPIYAAAPGGDAFGVGRLIWMCDLIKPDLIVIQQDPWNFPYYLTQLNKFDEYRGIPVIGIVAVDGKNCRGIKINGLSLAVFWTQFGLDEARAGGYTGPGVVIPLGVDLATYYPVDKREARTRLGLGGELTDFFIVGNVNRNQPRKRLDLMIEYFGAWVKRFNIKDALLAMHVAPTGDKDGIDCMQYAEYHGVILACIEPPAWYGVTEDVLRDTYNAFDVVLNTSQGEGMGLTILEACACGIPVIASDWAALGELGIDSMKLIPCTSTSITMYGGINSIGGVMDKELAIEALDDLYRNHHRRKLLGQAGLSLVREDRFRWSNIGRKFSDAIEEAVSGQKVKELVMA